MKKSKNKNLFLIHGAWASKQAFNYLIKKTLDDNNVGRIYCFEYDCQTESISSIIARAQHELKQLQSNTLDTIIVGHSLGGLFALLLSQEIGITKTITLAAPLSGIKLPIILQYFISYHTPVMKSLSPESKLIKQIHNKDYSKVPIDIIISCHGFNSMIYGKSDGVIPFEAQINWFPNNSKIIYSKTNHHEILQSAEFIISVEKALTIDH